jgi:CubicO group peptidase (beta-lactamase class C family)
MSQRSVFNCLLFSLIAIFLQILQPLNARAQKPAAPTFQNAAADQAIEQEKGKHGNTIVVLAWKDEKPIYQKETGDVKISTQQEIGAASSWLTAALVMTFVDQGKISLDDPVAKYLPIYRKYAKSYLTIRHCLANLTGLEAEKEGIQKLLQKRKFASLEEEVDEFASKREIINNPGIEFHYSNIGSSIAGRVLEVVGKKSFDRLMLERIFRPLGMKKSTFTSETAIDPYAGAKSTAEDYVKFLSMLLNKGTLNGKEVLTPASVEELQKIQTKNAKLTYAPKETAKFAYTLGSWVQEFDGNQNPVVFTCPGFTGVWPYMDTCRKYACVIMAKPQSKDEDNVPYAPIKDALEQQLGGGCQ